MTTSATDSGRHLILRLPGLVAGRDLANTMLDSLAESYVDRHVIIDASRTSSASPSFSSQLVQRVLIEGGAASLVIAGGPSRMVETARHVAGAAAADDRLEIVSHMPRRV